jgi:hypothetical protein
MKDVCTRCGSVPADMPELMTCEHGVALCFYCAALIPCRRCVESDERRERRG